MRVRAVIFALGIALASAANAADLRAAKPTEAPASVNCFSSLWTYLNSSAADCPLSYAGITLRGTIDVGLGYSSNGAPFSGTYSNGVTVSSASRATGPSGCGRQTA